MGQVIRRFSTVLRHVVPLAIGALCCWAVFQQISHIDFAQLWQSVLSVTAWHWAGAGLATALSFWAVARYDVIAHRHFRTGICVRRATLSGASAIAVGQTLGAGAIVGAFIRWRLLSGLGLVRAAKITAFVTLCFLGSWAVITSAAVLILPTANVHASIPCSVLAIAALMLGLAFFNPVLRRSGREVELPTLPALGAMLGLCLIDTLAAATALWLLLPASIDLSLAQIFPVYLIALGAAILSGTPGGVGPFELTLLALLPFVPETELMAAILAFRLIYYALPAVLGGLALLRPLSESLLPDDAQPSCLDEALRHGTARAELGIVRQNGGLILTTGNGTCSVVRTGQTLTSIFDPVLGHSADLASPLKTLARAQNRIVCKYKITARHALRARQTGWSVLHVADEALVRPDTHSMQGAPYRQLRRKLRNAEKSGIEIRSNPPILPFAEMAEISSAWEAANGGARGLSMGQFEPGYITHQSVFLAYHQGALLGFVTFHATAHEWCLDLMRLRPGAPDGAMHLLVNSAILAAKDAGVPRLSLAAAPPPPEGHGPLETALRGLVCRKSGGKGLRQFKASFNPHWQPLYMAAPGWGQLTLAAMDLIRSVRRATPLTAPARIAAPEAEPTHNS
ncbi:phosphatidylglycerol lysyltransferase domain-containing protein [Cognatishimia sp. SS12]|uniref:phosphatidylglycerol lysyltransferase domain-containing protein n=1 Tax=Cognatishimia sp. SS12 TaxID=2979465 RepID=UPI00232E62CE|nr:phosphatidylglycerol lysyltransferase domain-containing protein [Cognatishimia sp. SS12]MDC0737139.1 phosphatidylglycerol lysyltransferase domain-containing protein [Cognatishimia sp. SS12]